MLFKRRSLMWPVIFMLLTGCNTAQNTKSAPSPSLPPVKQTPTSRRPAPAKGRLPVKPAAKQDQQLLSFAEDWPDFGNNMQQDRFSPITDINTKNIHDLKLSSKVILPGTKGGNESFPVESRGIIYVTTSQAEVAAVQAASGTIQWTYRPNLHLDKGIPQINRGVALGQKRIYVLTPDDQLVALNRANGHLLYQTAVADQSQGYFESMAPLLTNGKILVGSSGGDQGVRGFLAAFQADNGKKLWQFYTIPKRGQGWVPAAGNHGGGAVWTTPAYDPVHHAVFFGTGNPSPDYYGKVRPGPDPYTDAVVALNERDGKLLWYRQEVAHDLWDYDAASPPLLFSLNGQLIVGEAGKDGFWYEWTADKGKQVIDPVAFVKQDHKPPAEEGTMEWPGADGGANYGPSAYDPLTQLVYVAGINGPETLFARAQSHQSYTPDLGTRQNPSPKSKWKGTVTAIRPDTGKIAWQIQTDTPPIGGVTANAGGIIFFGQANGTLSGVSAKTGKLLWRVHTGAPIGSAPIVFKYDHKSYVSVVTGGAKSLLSLFPWKGNDEVRTYEINVHSNH